MQGCLANLNNVNRLTQKVKKKEADSSSTETSFKYYPLHKLSASLQLDKQILSKCKESAYFLSYPG